jgi:uncharacterized membrane protein
MNHYKSKAWVDVIFGSLFTLCFLGIGLYAFDYLLKETKGPALMSDVLMIIIGILGVADGIKCFLRGYRIISQDKPA